VKRGKTFGEHEAAIRRTTEFAFDRGRTRGDLRWQGGGLQVDAKTQNDVLGRRR
jgi:hypothetical protein